VADLDISHERVEARAKAATKAHFELLSRD
jgi:hypothetical protein